MIFFFTPGNSSGLLSTYPDLYLELSFFANIAYLLHYIPISLSDTDRQRDCKASAGHLFKYKSYSYVSP